MRATCPVSFILLNFLYSIQIETKNYEAYLHMVFYILLATFRVRDILSFRAACLRGKMVLSGTDTGTEFNLQSNDLFSKITFFRKH